MRHGHLHNGEALKAADSHEKVTDFLTKRLPLIVLLLEYSLLSNLLFCSSSH